MRRREYRFQVQDWGGQRGCKDIMVWNRNKIPANIKMSLEFIISTSAYHFITGTNVILKKRYY
jgi:hypothetical protein